MTDPRRWRLWKVIKKRGLTIGDLAEMTKYSRGHLQRLKSGDRALSEGAKARISLALGLPPDFLFSEED